MPRTFPAGFLWGTATAAHQVEGGNHNNDWWDWEKGGGIKTGDSSDPACDTWNRYAEDIALLTELGSNAHRFSIEWSRVEPRPGEFDQEAIERYRTMLIELNDRQIAAMVTLHHFTSPKWFIEQGGWLDRRAPERWLPFVRRIADELGDLVSFWCTINEPTIYAYQGWLEGEFPPGRKGDVGGMLRVLANLRRAHDAAYAELKARTPTVPVGLAHHRWLTLPATGSLLDRVAARVAGLVMNSWPVGWRLRRVVDAVSDYVGINHYGGSLVSFSMRNRKGGWIALSNPSGMPVSDFGWVINPAWLGVVLDELRPTGKPVYITENGVASSDDNLRQEFLFTMLSEAWKAADRGLDLRGYFYWSSMDNFEWSYGYSMRFGLIEVDLDTQERTIKPSGRLLAKIAAANALPDTLPDRPDW